MKKLLACLLSAVLLVMAVLPGSVSAKEETKTKHQLAAEAARRSYTRSLRSARKSSFSGYCGLLASHQLWHMGVNSWCAVYNGKDQYDAYCTEQVTSGGYYIKPYSANQYSLEEALNAVSENGTKDVYNILVGFQRSRSAAGRRYGHACVINAILDGKVYMVESSYTKFGKEGQVIIATISQIAEHYKNHSFEGIIHFSDDYAQICNVEETELLLQTRFDSVLRSRPSMVGEFGCERLRSVAAGERLHATAVVTDTQGDVFYRVTDGSREGYIAAGAVGVLQVYPQAVTGETVALPKTSAPGEDLRLTGKLTGEHVKISAVEVTVTDAAGNILLREWAEGQGNTADLNYLNENLSFDLLEEGSYQVTMYADVSCPAMGIAGEEECYARQMVWSQSLQVGSAGPVSDSSESPADGWVYKNGKWYCYESGDPCTGWVECNGVSYYCGSDGAVTTGLSQVEGKTRYFTDTGALCTGWLTTDRGITYRKEDGTRAVGWQEIDRCKYFFDELGYLVTDAEVSQGTQMYLLGPDGKATEKLEEEKAPQ